MEMSLVVDIQTECIDDFTRLIALFDNSTSEGWGENRHLRKNRARLGVVATEANWSPPVTSNQLETRTDKLTLSNSSVTSFIPSRGFTQRIRCWQILGSSPSAQPEDWIVNSSFEA